MHQTIGPLPSDTMAVPLARGHYSQDGSDASLYAAIILSEALEREAEAAQAQSARDKQDHGKQDHDSNTVANENPIALENMIWVPAHKHPQIAPSEFAVWIKTHDMEHLIRKRQQLKRQKSKLSYSYTSDDSQSDGPASPTTPRDHGTNANGWDTQESGVDGIVTRARILDRFPVADQDSPILVPQESRSLSRRSAFSARGHHRKTSQATEEGVIEKRKRRSAPKPRRYSDANQSTPLEPFTPPPEGVTLYDRPVNISEWVDLGTAGLETINEHTILSRVQDAESHLFASPIASPVAPVAPAAAATPYVTPSETLPVTTAAVAAPTAPAIAASPPETMRQLTRRGQSRSMSLSLPAPNWLSNLFHEKKKPESNTKKFELKTLLPRSLSLRTKQKSVARISREIEPAMPEPKLQYNSYRLPIHTERAMYRLSHIKLANPRRPIRQQVLISNFMFWYLSIMNPQQQDTPFHAPVQPQVNERMPNALASTMGKLKTEQHQHRGEPGTKSHESLWYRSTAQRANQDSEDNIPLSYYSRT